MLATAGDWDLPSERHLHHREVLMQQIDHDSAPAALTKPVPRRRWAPRPAVWVPVASLALAGTLVITASGGGRPGSDPAARTGSVGVRAGSVSVTLDRIAAAAMATDATPVKDGQYVYVKSLIRENTGTFDGPVRLGALHRREVWSVQNPRPVTRGGWMRDSGKDAVMPGEEIPIEFSDATAAGIDRPTYQWLASLPTDPDALLRLLYARATVSEGESKDQAVFRTVGDLLGSTVMPPANAAALYEAVKRIPGITVIADAVDAAGRHGIGITRDDPSSATRDEWIFDRDSLAYLGSRSYVTHDAARGITKDTLAGADAVIERAVVDRHGVAPAAAGTAGG
ncbi:hypothetical protein WN71_008960 [Streptomyces mangrovisoli]|uniref:CU044_5270 family protein n=1 Tax=Streptomyces mangrovisoli TaxID=1428628 RepID=A0A1J4P0H9_9ACTN|nr:hypothetical protein WN71_008960 [Streptomyces mangrovisoli]